MCLHADILFIPFLYQLSYRGGTINNIIIFSGTFNRDLTQNMSTECSAYTTALHCRVTMGGGGGGIVTND